ncbi:hypothetical protein WJX73_004323 [Symbiochloris irregularis]|uniref:Thioredoxin domain-containing protein n=1 Tax=Symbiochloris irregularis TaxID=706552 RepID=A0AAW1NYV9_9CHLO
MLLSKVSLVVLCSLSVAALAAVSPSDGKDVLKLTTRNFEETVSQSKVTAVKFYAPWCGHCKKLAPTWKELAAHFSDNEDVQIADVDCTKHATVCKKNQVSGYPKLVLFFNGKQHQVFRGPRDLSTLKTQVDAAVSELLTQETIA